MKKIWMTLLAALLFCTVSVCVSQASSYSGYNRIATIASAKIRVNTGDLLPGDMLSDEASSYVTVDDSEYYTLMSAEWLDTVNYLKVGDEPRIRVYLNAIPRTEEFERYTKIWLFQGGYSASNVRITGGEYISSSIRDSGYTLEVTLRINPVKGQYEAPSSAYWETAVGSARWEASRNDSGLYDVILYRGEQIVKKLESYTGNWYNFYPYMTREGDYSYRIRCAVPETQKNTGARASDYTYSTNLNISASQVSDGTGQTTADEKGGSAGHTAANGSYPNGTGNEQVAGWVTDSTGTYFRYPNGEYAKNGWLRLNGSWYLLDAAGKRLTGWQQNPKKTGWFWLDPDSGVMRTGWLYESGHWYYLEPAEGDSQGFRISGWRDINGKRYYFNENGIMVTGWYAVNGKWYYFYPQGIGADGTYGHMAVNTKIGDFTIGADGTWEN